MTPLRKTVAALTLASLSTFNAQLSTAFAQAAFVKIVAAGDAVPDRPPGTVFTGILGGSAAPPAISAGRVAFVAAESDGNTSLWTASANGTGLVRIADRNTPVPDNTGTLYDLNPFELAGGRVVFRGHAYAPDHAGHYSAPAGSGALIRLADENTLIPGTANPFGTLPFDSGEFRCDATNYVFAPGNLGFILFVGATTTNGLMRRFADSTTRIQETNYFDINEYAQPDISGTNVVALVRGSGQAAIYRLPLSGLITNAGGYVLNATRVASKNTPLPGGPTNFHHTAFAGPVMDGETVVFRGGWTTNGVDFTVGLYSWVNGTLHKLVDTATPAPGGSGNFTANTLTIAVSGSDVVFQAGDSQRQAIYRVAATGAGIRKVLAVGDAFPFGTVAGNGGAFFQPPLQANSLDNGLLALRLDVTPPGGGNTASGIYLVRLRQLLAPALHIRVEGPDAVLSAGETLPGAQYQLQRRASLSAGDWLNLGSPTNGNDGTIEWRDAGRLTQATQFYRLVVTQ